MRGAAHAQISTHCWDSVVREALRPGANDEIVQRDTGPAVARIAVGKDQRDWA